MAEDKEEGEALWASGGSSVEEGHFSNGLDGQISTIEDQLKRAEATLFDLQSLRGKLEAERQANFRRAKAEQEHRESLGIKKENERLRKELKDYHTEIGSLKEIISSLKDDLVKTAEKLETKVARTLNSLEEDNSQAEPDPPKKTEEKRPTHTNHRIHHHESTVERNFFNDHLTKLSQPQVEKKDTEKVDAELAQNHTDHKEETATVESSASLEPQKLESKEEPQPPATKEENVTETNQPEAQASSTTASNEEKMSVQPESELEDKSSGQPAQPQSQPSMAEAMLNADAEPGKVQAAVVTELSQTSQQLEDNSLHAAELDEYEEIRKELEALESEAIFKPHHEASTPVVSPPQQSTPPPQALMQTPEATVAPIEAAKTPKPSFVSKIFHKKSKPEEKNTSQQLEPQPEQATVNASEQLKEITQSNIADPTSEPPKEPETQAAPVQTEQAQPSAARTEQTDIKPVVVENQAPASTPAESPQASPEEKAEDKNKHASLADLFKGKKKKVKGRIEDGRDDGVRRSGGGKIAIAAAVIVLIAGGTGVFFKIKNADDLRQMYISKATENVNLASESSNKSEVPDEFSNLNPEKKYKEAYADLPFAETAWSSYSDNEMGISLEYPKNTSYKLKPVGSTNIWFLRKTGYLLKIEKLTGQYTLGEVRDGIVASAKYKSENVVVRGNSTIHLVLEDDLPIKGNIYLTSVNNAIYKIWYKTFLPGENPDDEARVRKMLDSLDFVPIQ